MDGVKNAIDKSDDSLDGLMDRIGLPRFTEENITFIREYCEIYGPFAAILDVFQRDKNCFIGMLLPLLTSLEAELETASFRMTICKPLADALLRGIASRFDPDS